jgi:hypothetical protein
MLIVGGIVYVFSSLHCLSVELCACSAVYSDRRCHFLRVN